FHAVKGGVLPAKDRLHVHRRPEVHEHVVLRLGSDDLVLLQPHGQHPGHIRLRKNAVTAGHRSSEVPAARLQQRHIRLLHGGAAEALAHFHFLQSAAINRVAAPRPPLFPSVVHARLP
ncbi:hypothetical protein TraAM80_09351, partial [Trypanosoma rangeli]